MALSRFNGGFLRRLRLPRPLLADRIDIEKPVETADGQGGLTSTWTKLAVNVRTAIFDPTPGRRVVWAGQLQGLALYRLWLHDDIEGLDLTCRALDRRTGEHFRLHDITRHAGNTLMLGEKVIE